MFFALVAKGADGKLMVAKREIPPKVIADAKKAIGGSTPVTGKCFGGTDMNIRQPLLDAPSNPDSMTSRVKPQICSEGHLTIKGINP
jgi:hypothetical protein